MSYDLDGEITRQYVERLQAQLAASQDGSNQGNAGIPPDLNQSPPAGGVM